MSLGTVKALRRYPVKALLGEDLRRMEVDERGAVGDRMWALVDPSGKLASGKPVSGRFRKLTGLLEHRSRLEDGVPVIEPAGSAPVRGDSLEVEAAVESIAGPGWRLAREDGNQHHDAAPIHLVTTATMARLSADLGAEVEWERLRPNMLIDVPDRPGFVEDGWVGSELSIGDVRLRVRKRTERCVVTTHAQPGGKPDRAQPAEPAASQIAHRPEVLKQIGLSNEACAGVYADVLVPGTVELGATVRRCPG